MSVIQDTPLARGEWVAGKTSRSTTTRPTTSACGSRARSSAGSGEAARTPGLRAAPRRARSRPRSRAPTAPRTITVDTTHGFRRGRRRWSCRRRTARHRRARPRSRCASTTRRPSRVDVSVVGGDGWRNSTTFVAWSNPPEGDRAPIAECQLHAVRRAGGSCTRGEQTGDGSRASASQVPAPGEFTLRCGRRDAAGNASEEAASVPVTLRYDPEPPQLAFESAIAGDPTLVAVQVSDRVSGLADGTIEISRAGSDSWQTLATQREGNRLLARIDDAALPAGRLRAAGDRARPGRQPRLDDAAARRPADGADAAAARRRAAAGGFAQRARRAPHDPPPRQAPPCSTTRDRATAVRARARSAARSTVAGRLTSADGQGCPAPRSSCSRAPPPGAAEQPEALLHTDADGRFSYAAPGSASRTLRLLYAGAPRILPAQAESSCTSRRPARCA